MPASTCGRRRFGGMSALICAGQSDANLNRAGRCNFGGGPYTTPANARFLWSASFWLKSALYSFRLACPRSDSGRILSPTRRSAGDSSGGVKWPVAPISPSQSS